MKKVAREASFVFGFLGFSLLSEGVARGLEIMVSVRGIVSLRCLLHIQLNIPYISRVV